MRKIILFNMITLDGFFAGPHGEIDWHHVDEEFNEYAIEQLNEAGGLIFGRVTYQMMASYWPTTLALEDDPVVANKMNSISKIVVSQTLEAADWANTRMIKRNAVEELQMLKKQPGGDLFVFGSADLAVTLIQHDQIDEHRLIVNPVILGKGLPMYKDVEHSLSLKLTRLKAFKNGNILLVYQSAKNDR